MIATRTQGRPPVRSECRGPHQHRPGLVDGLMDALVTQPHRRIVWEPSPQLPADLLGTPPLFEQLADQLAEFDVGLDATTVAASPPCGRFPMRVKGTVALLRNGVAAQLPRDRRWCAPQLLGDLADAHTGMAHVGDLDSFVLRKEPRANLPHGQPLERWLEPDDLAIAIDLVATGPVGSGRAGDTDFLRRGADAPPPFPQLHEPLAFGRLRTPPRPLLHTTRRRQHNSRRLERVATVARNHPDAPGSVFNRR